ncbi:hypothetical protein ZWY2020_020494, partial [Hordeum vulgare]
PTGSATTHVRQSVLYSARRGHRCRKGRRKRTEVSSSELGHTSADLSQLDALTLNTTPPTLQSADRAEEHSTEVRSSERGGTGADLSKDEGIYLNVASPAYESTSMPDSMIHLRSSSFCPNKQSLEKLALHDSRVSHRLDLWMEKEVMKAFKKCIIGVEFELDELLHQCFSVETHDKMFHHYNFTVKMKEAGSDKWSSSTLYFAEVKEMYGRKFTSLPLDQMKMVYTISSLLYLFACKNRGMNALQHPAVPIGYEATDRMSLRRCDSMMIV